MLDRNNINTMIEMVFKGNGKFTQELARLIVKYQNVFKLDTEHRLAMFLANAKEEVLFTRRLGFKTVVTRENLNYSSKALPKVFRSFNKELASKYGRTLTHKADQEMIANIAYANRLGNGSVESGDGWKYRGGGILQTTGKTNWVNDVANLKTLLGLDLFVFGELDTEMFNDTTMFILLGMSYWERMSMYDAPDIDSAVDIINKYTASRGKRVLNYERIMNV